MRPGFTVERAGIATTVQDRGRFGYAHLGVPGSGFADRQSAALANRLVGNLPHAALLETSGEIVVRADRDCWIAVCGANGPIWVNDVARDVGRCLYVAHDSRLRIGAPRTGMRYYVAVDGGISGAAVLDSLSTDTLSGIVAVPVLQGSVLGSGTPHAEPAFGDPLPPSGIAALSLSPGPRASWCTAESMSTLVTTPWTVAAEVNRIGVRLAGPSLQRTRHDELPSEGLVRGAMQLLPSGSIIVMIADHPVTGGYPVIAVLDDDAVDALAQSRPGDDVHFRWSRIVSL